ncbi:MAG TPA: hypothetical protein P5117_04975 [Spirochaetia bacterium]|nr:hypothetical protein [Spirochaetales bacterium]HRY80093.1 hypothetical protein [Spirochaetia bacterium]HRZ88821.1 hypothetical protein [Spirochaetia bacterium]
MKSLMPLVLLAIILALLVVTNPTKQDFAAWYGKQAAASAPSGTLGKALGGIGKGMASVAASAFQRQSYGVLSVFSLAKGGTAYVGLGKVVFLKVR